MSDRTQTIDQRLKSHFESLTRAERQLAHLILENYPVSGLGSITAVAQNADVSTPTVARMVQKIGFKGFPEFQAELRSEIEAKIKDPIARLDTWSEDVPEAHILNRFTEAVIENIRQSLKQIDIDAFDAACRLLADNSRSVFVVGGRITRALADYLFLHMQMIRKGVVHIPSIANAWPHYLLDIKKGDVLVIFDVRRYENSTLKLAEMAAERGAQIILFTDQWRSPVAKHADHCLSTRIEVPSAWDSSITTMLLLEIIIAEINEQNRAESRSRIEALEDIFDRTRFFRKFT